MDAEETKVFILVIILGVVLGTIIIAFFVSMIYQQMVNLRLKKQNLIAELNSIEKERARIAADLHDELSPVLSAVKLKISSFDLQDPEDRVQQAKTDQHLSDLLKRMREISFDLMPVTLQRRGLVAALQELIANWYQKESLQIELVAEDIRLSETYSIHIYRIVQEIIHNTIKHAGASLLQIELQRDGGKLILATRDNGQGFNDSEELAEGKGFGLRNLQSRTDVLSGEIVLESGKGKGTMYRIEIPLH